MSRVDPATSSEREPPLPAAAPPLPVQPLDYCEGDRTGAWSAVVNVMAWVAIAMGATEFLRSIGQTWGPAAQVLLGGPAGRASFFAMGWQPYLAIEVAADAAAVTLVVAGAHVFRRRPWVPTAMIAAAATAGAAVLARSLLQQYQFLVNPAYARSMPGRWWYYGLGNLSSLGHALILPAILVWVMSRPAVREHFRGLRPG